MARQVDWVYDFALPPLVLHALYARDVSHLCRWLGIRPRNAVTVLDTHDGIGVQDVDADPRRPGPGCFHRRTFMRWSQPFTSAVVARAVRRAAPPRATWTCTRSTARSMTRSAGAMTSISSRARFSASCPASRRSTTSGCSPAATTWNCCGARVSAATSTATTTWMTNVVRAMERPVVQCAVRLLRFRNSHPSFGGTSHVSSAAPDQLVLEWRNGVRLVAPRR